MSSATVGWLRIVRRTDGAGVLACLFETSPAGEPREFAFGCTELCADPDDSGLAPLAASLLRSGSAALSLVFALADEVSPRLCGALEDTLPICRVTPPSPAGTGASPGLAGAGPWMQWTKGLPPPGSTASEALAGIVGRGVPLEPLERAGNGLTEAFRDPPLRALAGSVGLTSVMTLRGFPEFDGECSTGIAGRPAYGSAFERESRTDHGLADRLRTLLAPPGEIAAAGAPGGGLEWWGELMPFQREGVRALIGMDRLLLSDDMGLGKTIQTVAALRILRARREIGSSLVVAPAGLLDQWRREIARWAPELAAIVVRGSTDDRAWQWKARADVTLVGYDTLRSDIGLLAALCAGRGPFGAVVVDEAQRIKNRNETSEVVKSIPRRRSWALSGTPIENDEEELASIMEFVDHDGSAPVRRYRAGAALRERHRALQLRRKKADVLEDLPPKLETRLKIPLHPDQRLSYERAERDGIVYLNSLGSEVGIRHVLELIARLKQICNADPKTGASSKLDDIRDRLLRLAAQGHRALIFSQYTSDTAGVAAAANRLRDLNPLTLTGDMPSWQRSAVVDRFRNEPAHKALILSLRAGGVGLNLQEASYVFHLDRWWNPAVERQAEDRAHRVGQPVKVNVIKYVCENTVEERIDRILDRKRALFDRLIDDVSIDLSSCIERTELMELFGLR